MNLITPVAWKRMNENHARASWRKNGSGRQKRAIKLAAEGNGGESEPERVAKKTMLLVKDIITCILNKE